MMAYLTPIVQLRLQDKLDISDGAVFCIQQELGPVGGNDEAGIVQDVCRCVARCGDAQDMQNVKKCIPFSV